jgi:hypothetical protein
MDMKPALERDMRLPAEQAYRCSLAVVQAHQTKEAHSGESSSRKKKSWRPMGKLSQIEYQLIPVESYSVRN